jgi:hypothetical protein
MRWIMAGAFLLLVAGVSLADLDQARAEPNLEKRSKLALDNAVAALKEAREAYKAGDMQKVTAKASEVQESAELAFTSLVKTGKDPRKSPKWFKRAEIESRDLLRSIETLEHDMSLDDRVILEKAKEKVRQVHDDLLTGLMEGKRK